MGGHPSAAHSQPSLASLAWGSSIPARLFSLYLSTGLLPRQDSKFPPIPRNFLRIWPQASSSLEREREFRSLGESPGRAQRGRP